MGNTHSDITACEKGKLVKSALSVGKAGVSPTDSWILNMNDGRTLFLKVFISPQSDIDLLKADTDINIVKMQLDNRNTIDERKALNYEARIYKYFINKIVERKLNPSFIPSEIIMESCSFDNLLNVINSDPSTRDQDRHNLLRNLSYLLYSKYLDIRKKPHIQKNGYWTREYDNFRAKGIDIKPEFDGLMNDAVCEMHLEAMKSKNALHVIWELYKTMRKSNIPRNIWKYDAITLPAFPTSEIPLSKFLLKGRELYRAASETGDKEGKDETIRFVAEVIVHAAAVNYIFWRLMMSHNDLHGANVRVVIRRKPVRMTYKYGDKSYGFDSYLRLIVFDFDRSWVDVLGKNDNNVGWLCTEHNQCNKYVKNKDFMQIINTIALRFGTPLEFKRSSLIRLYYKPSIHNNIATSRSINENFEYNLLKHPFTTTRPSFHLTEHPSAILHNAFEMFMRLTGDKVIVQEVATYNPRDEGEVYVCNRENITKIKSEYKEQKISTQVPAPSPMFNLEESKVRVRDGDSSKDSESVDDLLSRMSKTWREAELAKEIKDKDNLIRHTPKYRPAPPHTLDPQHSTTVYRPAPSRTLDPQRSTAIYRRDPPRTLDPQRSTAEDKDIVQFIENLSNEISPTV